MPILQAIIVDAHMPTCDTVTCEQIEESLDEYLSQSKVRGLILTGLDDDHACPNGVSTILTRYEPDWVMYPKYFKDTDAATEVFRLTDQHVSRRKNTSRPLSRESVRVDRVESRQLSGLGRFFNFELFSPHMSDMDSSNNSSIVMKVTGLDATGFRSGLLAMNFWYRAVLRSPQRRDRNGSAMRPLRRAVPVG
jgi:beta-lactamase superfamily II metal-dependent hydrolase